MASRLTCSTILLTWGLSLGAGLLKGFPLPRPPPPSSASSSAASASDCLDDRVALFEGPKI